MTDWRAILAALGDPQYDDAVHVMIHHGPDAVIDAALTLADDPELAHIARVAVMSGRVRPLRLAALATSPSLEMRMAVVQSPCAPADVVRQIAEHGPSRTARMVATQAVAAAGHLSPWVGTRELRAIARHGSDLKRPVEAVSSIDVQMEAAVDRHVGASIARAMAVPYFVEDLCDRMAKRRRDQVR